MRRRSSELRSAGLHLRPRAPVPPWGPWGLPGHDFWGVEKGNQVLLQFAGDGIGIWALLLSLFLIFIQWLLYVTVQAAESVMAVMNRALETNLFYCAYVSVPQVGMYIQMTECSKTTCFTGLKAICICIRVWINKKQCQPASLVVVSCHDTNMLTKQAIVEKSLGFPILFWDSVIYFELCKLWACLYMYWVMNEKGKKMASSAFIRKKM